MNHTLRTTLIHTAGALILSTLLPLASASIIKTTVKWPTGSDGLARINVCIVAGSSTQQRGDGAQAGLIHDPNPTLPQVLERVRAALSNTWEAYGNVRFIGWRNCAELTSAEQANSIGLYIHPDSNNQTTGLGTEIKGNVATTRPAVAFKPWGNSFNRCIYYNAATTHVAYQYDCAEQYAIHEFGHALGYQHEWEHPLKPSTCSESSKYQLNQQNADPVYRIGDPTKYDWNSIMNYLEPGCSQKVGVRFGTTTLSPLDIAHHSKQYAYPAMKSTGTEVDPKYYYKITLSTLPNAALDSSATAPQMAAAANVSGQFWRFSFEGGCYRMTNMFQGPSKSMETNGVMMSLGTTAASGRQCWNLVPTGNGSYRISNSEFGLSSALFAPAPIGGVVMFRSLVGVPQEEFTLTKTGSPVQ